MCCLPLCCVHTHNKGEKPHIILKEQQEQRQVVEPFCITTHLFVPTAHIHSEQNFL